MPLLTIHAIDPYLSNAKINLTTNMSYELCAGPIFNLCCRNTVSCQGISESTGPYDSQSGRFDGPDGDHVLVRDNDRLQRSYAGTSDSDPQHGNWN